MKKLMPLFLALVMILGLLTGCGATQTASDGSAEDTAASSDKTMVIGDTTFNSENWEETVDPHTTYNGWACIRYGIGETLVHYTDNMELEPWLATDWENDGDLTWTITLRDDVKFSSGRILVTHDPAQVSVRDLVEAVAAVGYTAKPSAI